MVKVPKRKFKIIGWRAAKRLNEMTTAELITMRDRVSDYWARIEEICLKLIEKLNNQKEYRNENLRDKN